MGSYLFNEFLVSSNISARAIEGLLQEGEQDSDNDTSLDGFSEDDEEDGNGKDIDSHDGDCSQCSEEVNQSRWIVPLKCGWQRHAKDS
jgi:hypothetical protein